MIADDELRRLERDVQAALAAADPSGLPLLGEGEGAQSVRGPTALIESPAETRVHQHHRASPDLKVMRPLGFRPDRL